MPTSIGTLYELNSHLSKSKDKISVIKFEASWCGPCHAIAPAFQELSERYQDVNFFKVDVDQAREVAQQYRVTAMPTFVFLKGSDKVDQVRGANKAALEDMLRKLSGPPSASRSGPKAFSGKGQTLGGSSSSSSGSVNVRQHVNAAFGLNPQLQVFLALVGLYILLYWVTN